MNLKFILLSAILNCSLLQCYSQDFWENLHSPVNTNDIAITSEGFLFISNSLPSPNTGGVYRSLDSGLNWEMMGFSNFSIEALTVNAMDEIIIGGIGKLYKSSDFGISWDEVFTAYPTNFQRIRCGFDSLVFALGSNQSAIMRSGDYGNNWSNVYDSSNPNYQEVFTDITFSVEGTIYACSRTLYGGNGKIYYSTDLGYNWYIFECPDNYYGFYSLAVDNDGNLLAGADVGFCKYNFSTNSWDILQYSPYRSLDILVLADNSIYLACPYTSPSYGGVYVSLDDGQNFTQLNSGLNWADARRLKIDMVGRLLAVAGGVYRSYDTILITSVNEIETDISVLKFIPNPFSSLVNIELSNSLWSANSSKISIYNMQGKMVHDAILYNSQRYSWKPDNLPSGTYIVVMQTGVIKLTGKVIKIQNHINKYVL